MEPRLRFAGNRGSKNTETIHERQFTADGQLYRSEPAATNGWR